MPPAANIRQPSAEFWRGKRVLLTGHTGFKGAWLAIWLHRLGARVTGMALPPNTQPSLFELANLASCVEHNVVDIREPLAVANMVRDSQPEVVFHLAAQALVRPSYTEPLDTWSTNLMGTVHLLDALRQHPAARVAVMVTTDKVYRNLEWPHPYRESDELGGHDPYSASKAACELAIGSYRDAFLAATGTRVASARAGNVIGGGDWANDRLLPDAVLAWQQGEVLHVRRPDGIRPWQHVLEPLAGYLCLAQAMWHDDKLSGPWNFGPHSHEQATVRQVVEWASAAWGRGANVEFGAGEQGPHEAGRLTLDTSKSQSQLKLWPHWSVDQSVKRTMRWYQAQRQGASAIQLCLQDLADWEASA